MTLITKKRKEFIVDFHRKGPTPPPFTSTTELWRGFTQSKTLACTVATHSPGINYKVHKYKSEACMAL